MDTFIVLDMWPEWVSGCGCVCIARSPWSGSARLSETACGYVESDLLFWNAEMSS